MMSTTAYNGVVIKWPTAVAAWAEASKIVREGILGVRRPHLELHVSAYTSLSEFDSSSST